MDEREKEREQKRGTEREEPREKRNAEREEDGLGLFGGKYEPDAEWGWTAYEEAVKYNVGIQLSEQVRVNENFYVGKQWEGVITNGLPTPQVNFLKRTTGFTVSSIVSDSLRINALPMASFPEDDKLIDPVRIVNEEFETIAEQNRLPALTKEFARDAAVRGDGCIYSWWDEDADGGPAAKNRKGRIRSEVVKNTRVYFGDPNNNRVQEQPWIMLEKREFVRTARKRAKANGVENWREIMPDDEINSAEDQQKRVDGKVTTVQLFWKDEEDGEIRCYEFCHSCEIRKPWNLNIRLYPFVWLSWDDVADCYHGQAMITGMVPNQIFVNRAWAMSMVSINRTAYPRLLYDKTRISHLDNRVGSAIGVNGNVDGAMKAADTGHIDPQVHQYINEMISETQESMGATEAALGEGKAYNTSAILSLQKAASTPQELTKQRLYQQIEDLSRIYLEFMAEYFGTRTVDMAMTDEMRKQVYEPYIQLTEANGMEPPEVPKTVPVDFDFGMLKDHPFSVKVDVGTSSLYSETSSLSTLDNLLMNGFISPRQYLEHIPDGTVSGRRELIDELKEAEEQQKRMAEQQAQQQAAAQAQQDEIEAGREEAARQEQAIAENGSAQERRTTGFKELGEALRSLQRRQAQ